MSAQLPTAAEEFPLCLPDLFLLMQAHLEKNDEVAGMLAGRVGNSMHRSLEHFTNEIVNSSKKGGGGASAPTPERAAADSSHHGGSGDNGSIISTDPSVEALGALCWLNTRHFNDLGGESISTLMAAAGQKSPVASALEKKKKKKKSGKKNDIFADDDDDDDDDDDQQQQQQQNKKQPAHDVAKDRGASFITEIMSQQPAVMLPSQQQHGEDSCIGFTQQEQQQEQQSESSMVRTLCTASLHAFPSLYLTWSKLETAPALVLVASPDSKLHAIQQLINTSKAVAAVFPEFEEKKSNSNKQQSSPNRSSKNSSNGGKVVAASTKKKQNDDAGATDDSDNDLPPPLSSGEEMAQALVAMMPDLAASAENTWALFCNMLVSAQDADAFNCSAFPQLVSREKMRLFLLEEQQPQHQRQQKVVALVRAVSDFLDAFKRLTVTWGRIAAFHSTDLEAQSVKDSKLAALRAAAAPKPQGKKRAAGGKVSAAASREWNKQAEDAARTFVSDFATYRSGFLSDTMSERAMSLQQQQRLQKEGGRRRSRSAAPASAPATPPPPFQVLTQQQFNNNNNATPKKPPQQQQQQPRQLGHVPHNEDSVNDDIFAAAAQQQGAMSPSIIAVTAGDKKKTATDVDLPLPDVSDITNEEDNKKQQQQQQGDESRGPEMDVTRTYAVRRGEPRFAMILVEQEVRAQPRQPTPSVSPAASEKKKPVGKKAKASPKKGKKK